MLHYLRYPARIREVLNMQKSKLGGGEGGKGGEAVN